MSLREKLKIAQAKMEFSAQKKQVLLDIIAEFLQYGLSMHAIFSDIFPKLYEKGSLNLIVTDIGERISTGATLAQALTEWYGVKVAAIVRSGEDSDNLYEALKLAVESLNANRSYIIVFLKKIAYSLMVLISSWALMGVFYFSVIPSFLEILVDQKKEVPFITTFYMSYGHFIFGGAGLIALVLLLLAIIGVGVTILYYTGSGRDTLDRLPVFALYRQMIGADLLEQLGFYFKANILLDAAVNNILQVARRPYLRLHGERILERMEEGVDNITEAFDTGLFDRGTLVVMLAMGRINRFESKCLEYACRMQQDTIRTVTKVGVSWGMVFMVLGAINILWSLGAMYTGIAALQG